PADEELAWVAEGVPAGAGVYPRVYEQAGSFEARPEEEGDVYFPFPYATPPNVELTGFPAVLIDDVTPLGLRWRHAAKTGERGGAAGSVRWTAHGVRATADEYRRAVERGPRLPAAGVVEQTGWFTASRSGEEVEVFFPRPFAAPPNVWLDDSSSFIVSEC